MDEATALSYLGHSAFLLTSPQGIRILIDPYGNREGREWFLRPFPDIVCDLLLFTHDHFDHTGMRRIPENAIVVREAGVIVRGDVAVTGIRDVHVSEGPVEMPNVMFRLDIAGLRFLHFGDNRADVPAVVRAELRNVDVLMIPVDDSCHLLRFDQVDALSTSIDPKVIIPMHYAFDGLTSAASTLKPCDRWLASQSVVRKLGNHEVKLIPARLPRTREVWVLAPVSA